MKRKFIDPNSQASNEGGVKLSKRKWKDIKKIYSLSPKSNKKLKEIFKIEKECLFFGSVEPCVVVSLYPLLIAVYSEDMDAVLLLQFAPDYIGKYSLDIGSRLISANTYGSGDEISKDIFVGEGYSGCWTDFTPHLADFLTEDKEKLDLHKEKISEDIWNCVEKLGKEYLLKHSSLSRNGFWFLNKRL